MTRGVVNLLLMVMMIGPAVAADPRRPTVTVATFDAGPTLHLSREHAGMLADDLASRLVESGRFRVLDRDWLPIPTSGLDRLPLPVLREAARSAGVDYVVTGTVIETTTTPSIQGGLILGTVRTFLGRPHFGARGPRCQPTGSRRRSFSVRVRVVDAWSGVAIRTSVAQSSLPTAERAGAGWLTNSCTPTGTVLAAVATESSAPRIEGLQQANAEIARTLVLPVPSEIDSRSVDGDAVAADCSGRSIAKK